VQRKAAELLCNAGLSITATGVASGFQSNISRAREPALVTACVEAMKREVKIPVTVKCRIGIDDQDPEMALDALARGVIAKTTAGITADGRYWCRAGITSDI
jgi:hypothetical protein